MRYFCEDSTATTATRITGTNRNMVNRYYQLLRKKIAAYQESVNKEFRGEVKLDENYFGGHKKGRRGRGTAKIPVFGILKRNGRIYTQINLYTDNQKRPIIKKLVRRGSIAYTDGRTVYEGLVLNGYRHNRINHGEQRYSNKHATQINGIENFWSFAKRRLLRFNNISPKTFYFNLLKNVNFVTTNAEIPINKWPKLSNYSSLEP